MKHTISKQQVRKLIGKKIYAYKKDGTVVSGKLQRMNGNTLYVQSLLPKHKVRTKAIIPLVLFDLLAIGTAPFAYGSPYGYGYGGVGGFGGYPGGFGGYGYGPGGFGGYGPGGFGGYGGFGSYPGVSPFRI